MFSTHSILITFAIVFEILCHVSSTRANCSTYTGEQLQQIIAMVKTLFNTYAQYVDDTSKQYPPLYRKFDTTQDLTFDEVETWVTSLLGYYSLILRQERRVDYLDATHRQQIINAIKTYLQNISQYTNNGVPGKTVLENELRSLENAV